MGVYQSDHLVLMRQVKRKERPMVTSPTGHNTYGQQYRNHAAGCEDEYDHPGSCRPMGETLMPDDRKSDHDVPIREFPFVKKSNYPGYTTNVVHLEGPTMPLTRVPGTNIYLPSVQSQTLCGKRFTSQSFFFPQGWNHAPRYQQWTTCKTCHRVAITEYPTYKEVAK